MAELISRKQFFRQAFMEGVKFSADMLAAFQPAGRPGATTDDDAFAADFPPDLLADEAARLGIDPEDKAAVYAAISERLNLQKT